MAEFNQVKFDNIISSLEEGHSLRKSLGFENISSRTFYEWINSDDELKKQYARACEERAEKIFEEILEIADKQGEDVIEVDGEVITNHNVINRARLQVDARKWMLGKMQPKKYGDKLDLDHTTNGKDMPGTVIDASKLSTEALEELLKAQSEE